MRRTAGHNILFTVIIILLIGVIAFSAYHIYEETEKYRQGNREYDKIESVAGADKPGSVINWEELRKVNPDIVAWIKMPQEDGTINYPIVQTDNNTKYLHTLFDGSRGACGTLFVDKACEKDFVGFNTIVYGHHMGRRFYKGPMFGKLEKFRDQEFYDGHSWMWFYTPDRTYKLLIVAGYTTPADVNSYPYKITFNDDSERMKFIENMNNESDFVSKYDCGVGDRYVTLSTCAYEYHNARYVVVGKLEPAD